MIKIKKEILDPTSTNQTARKRTSPVCMIEERMQEVLRDVLLINSCANAFLCLKKL